jgi:hypothetical protein
LRYQIHLAKQYARSSFFRCVKDLVVPDDWKAILSTITELDETISQQLTTLGNHTLSEVDKKMEKLQEMMPISLRLATDNIDHARVCHHLSFGTLTSFSTYRVTDGEAEEAP